MMTRKKKLLQLTKEKDCNSIKVSLESLDYQVKGEVFEWYLAELYRGNGWLTNVRGGRQDLGGRYPAISSEDTVKNCNGYTGKKSF